MAPRQKQIFVGELAQQPAPLPVIGSAIRHALHVLQDMTFYDNEYGDAVQVARASTRALQIVNGWLERSGRPARVISFKINPKNHHLVQMEFMHAGESRQIPLSLYPPSKRTREAESDESEDSQVEAPKRGRGKAD